MCSRDSHLLPTGSLPESYVIAAELARARQQIDRDARRVGEHHRSRLPRIPGLEIAAINEPSGRPSGDLYDVFRLELAARHRLWCLFVGDACGHGLAAAPVMAMVQSILHAHPPHIRGPADMLAHVNRHLCDRGIRGFVTAFLGIYEPRSRRLTYACAGHPPPLVRSSVDGGISRLAAVASCPLAIQADETFEEATIRISPGDAVLFYTDGITETRNPSNEMFTEARLQSAFGDCRNSPMEIVNRLEQIVSSYRQGRARRDDQTLVAIPGV